MLDWVWVAIIIFGACVAWLYPVLQTILWISDYRDKKRRERLDKEFHEKHKNDPSSQGSIIDFPLTHRKENK